METTHYLQSNADTPIWIDASSLRGVALAPGMDKERFCTYIVSQLGCKVDRRDKNKNAVEGGIHDKLNEEFQRCL